MREKLQKAKPETSCNFSRFGVFCIPEVIDEYDCGGEGGRQVKQEAVDN